MIPRAHVTAWRAIAPWPTDAQVEQDLVLSRALVDMFNNPEVAHATAFRGGTALHKFFFEQPTRYSEDIDLVQINAGPIGPTLDEIRASLDPWLGEPKRKQSHGRVTLLYRFETTTKPIQPMRLKIEINTREHFAVFGMHHMRFVVANPWYSGNTNIGIYQIEELLGTKLRALYQRKKGRDLYDLWLSLTTLGIEAEKVVECFGRYMTHGGFAVSRAEFEANLAAKLQDPAFIGDTDPLLPTEVTYSTAEAGALVGKRLIANLPGAPWKRFD